VSRNSNQIRNACRQTCSSVMTGGSRGQQIGSRSLGSQRCWRNSDSSAGDAQTLMNALQVVLDENKKLKSRIKILEAGETRKCCPHDGKGLEPKQARTTGAGYQQEGDARVAKSWISQQEVKKEFSDQVTAEGFPLHQESDERNQFKVKVKKAEEDEEANDMLVLHKQNVQIWRKL